VIGTTGVSASGAEFQLSLQGSCLMWAPVAVGATMFSDPAQPRWGHATTAPHAGFFLLRCGWSFLLWVRGCGAVLEIQRDSDDQLLFRKYRTTASVSYRKKQWTTTMDPDDSRRCSCLDSRCRHSITEWHQVRFLHL